jgi:molybdopterin converting factor small subunit
VSGESDYATALGEQLGKTIDNLERTLEVVATLDELVKRLERRLDELERRVERDLRLSKAAREGRLVP